MFVIFGRIFGCTGTRLRNFIFASRALAVCAHIIAAAVMLGAGQVGWAQSVFDNAGNALIFSGGPTGAKVVGDSHTFTNVATISGTQINAKVTVMAINNATLDSFDSGSSPYSSTTGAPFFQPNVDINSVGGSVTFKVEFLNTSGAAVTLQNVYANTYDLDGAGGDDDGRQFTDFSGIASYALSTDTKIVRQVPSAGVTRFITTQGGNDTTGPGTATQNTIRARVFYSSVSSTTITVGDNGFTGLSYYAIDFSLGFPFGTAANQAPVADAGADQTVSSAAAVTLNGTASRDPDTADTISYAWTQTSGTSVTLSSATAASPTFTAPTLAVGNAAVELVFSLIVTDSQTPALSSAADTVKITINAPTASGADTGTSTITASPTTVLADGTTTSTITVQLKDASGNNLTTGGAVVTLASSRNSTPGTDTISGVTDNGNGTYTFTVTSTIAGNSTYTGTVGGATITDTAAVAFTAVAASPITSTITASPTTVLADGTSTSTITVQLKDASGNNLTSSGGIVTLSSNLAGSTLSSVIDRGNGTYTATLTSIAAGPALITGTLAGVGMTDTETVTFDAGPVLTGPDGAGGTTTAAAFAISLPEGGTAVSQITSDVAVTTWALGGVDAAQFSIASDGTITFRAATDYENPSDTGGDNVYTITVSATDADGFTTTRTLTVTITDAALPGTPPTTGTDNDGDGVADTIESSSADRDGDGISDAQDYDPQGYFYCQADGAILAGGVVTVTGPGTVNMVKNGSATGEYQWYVDAAGTYTMAIDTSGMQYPLIGTASAGAITLAGRGNPIVIGHTQDAATGYLGDFNGAAYNAAAPTAYYTTFVIAEGDGNVFGNNIPMLGCNNSVTIAKTTDGREPSGTAGTGTTGRFSVTLGRVSNVPVTLTYTVAGSAAAGSDFTALSGSVTIPAGQLSAVIDVAVLADTEADSGETVILTLTSASGGAVVLGSAVSATLTLSDGLIATIEDRLETVLQDDFNQTIALQSRQFAAMASDALTRLRFAGPNIDCSNADDTDLDGNGDAGLGSIALTADYLRTQYSCATRTRRLDYGGLSFATFDGQGTQAMLNFGTAREVQNDTSIDGRFVGGYVSLNSVTGQDMGGQITGVGANAGLYGARKLDSGLYLDTYAAAAVGYHSYDLLFDSTINAQGDYSYIGVFAGAAVSGDIGYDNATLRPRAGLDLGYGAASRASVRAYDTAASETGFITLDPARGLRAYGEVGILFGEDAKTQTDGQTGAQTDGAATSLQVRRGFGMTPRVFCEDGFGARNAGCGYGFGIEFSETKPQDNVAWHMSMDVERIEDLTRGDVEITREREFWNGAGAWSTGIAAGADGGFSAAQGVKITW